MFSQSYETHKYETLFSDDEFEIRLYEPVLKAKTYSTKVQIIILENYLDIFLVTTRKEKISMTTPVYMKNEDKGSMMEFVLPSKYDMKNVSMPLSSNVEIYLDEGGHYASIQYGGYSNKIKKKYTNALIKKLQEHNVEAAGEMLYLSYDSPYKFYGRRNEVIIAVKY